MHVKAGGNLRLNQGRAQRAERRRSDEDSAVYTIPKERSSPLRLRNDVVTADAAYLGTLRLSEDVRARPLRHRLFRAEIKFWIKSNTAAPNLRPS
jgi:hypothetical protein